MPYYSNCNYVIVQLTETGPFFSFFFKIKVPLYPSTSNFLLFQYTKYAAKWTPWNFPSPLMELVSLGGLKAVSLFMRSWFRFAYSTISSSLTLLGVGKKIIGQIWQIIPRERDLRDIKCWKLENYAVDYRIHPVYFLGFILDYEIIIFKLFSKLL